MSRDYSKYLFLFFFFSIIFSSCVSPKKFLSRAQYDLAIEYSVKKLRKNPSHKKSILIIEESFETSNQIDNERIKLLELEKHESNSEDIFNIYNRMKRRQVLIKTVYPFKSDFGSNIILNFVDFDAKMISYKHDAAEYLYKKAHDLLLEEDKILAREAYSNLVRVKNYYPDFNNKLDADIKKAKIKGTVYFIIEVKNKSNVIFPKTFARDVTRISLDGLNKKWKVYHSDIDQSVVYDYLISLNIKDIQVSPETQREKEYNKSKKIIDGVEYVLDNNGNVLKDSLGNDVTKPKEIVITCSVNEIYQKKSTVVVGNLEYTNFKNNQVKFTDPIRYEISFEHTSAICAGDKRALNKETKSICGVQPLPFPNDNSMIMMTVKGLKDVTKNIIIKRDGNLK